MPALIALRQILATITVWQRDSGRGHFGGAASLHAPFRVLAPGRVHSTRHTLRLVPGAVLLAAVCTVPVAAAVYEIGPSKPFRSIGSAPWASLGPGDVVKIYWRPEPYREKIMVTQSGTAQQHFTIQGVPGPHGELPILDGKDATTSPQFIVNYAPIQDCVIYFWKPRSKPWAYKPSYVDIDNLEIRNASAPYMYTDYAGATRSYNPHACGLWADGVDHLRIRGCIFDWNANGILLKCGGDEATCNRDIVIERCWFHDNGTVGSDRTHNVYTEAVGAVFQYNLIGPLRRGALGNTLKDRSAGTIIRYNVVELNDPAHVLDLVEAEDGYRQITVSPSYHDTYVYGNLLLNGPDGAGSLVHYGSDNSPTEARTGTLHFAYNTVVNIADRKSGGRWRTSVFKADGSAQRIDLQNDILLNLSPEGGDASDFALLAEGGRVECGRNWTSPDCRTSAAVGADRSQVTSPGVGLPNQRNDPGFVDLQRGNLALHPGAPCLHRADVRNLVKLPDRGSGLFAIGADPGRGDSAGLDVGVPAGIIRAVPHGSWPFSWFAPASGRRGAGLLRSAVAKLRRVAGARRLALGSVTLVVIAAVGFWYVGQTAMKWRRRPRTRCNASS